jgi:hypothetical protein
VTVAASLESTRQSRFWHRAPEPEWDAEVMAAARRAGHLLTQFETDTGQLVWSWGPSHRRGPSFLTRRVALAWMADVLERNDDHGL